MITRIQPKDYDVICDNPIPGVYGLESLFTDAYCEEIIKAACEKDAWTTTRHEDYPTYDMPLVDISEGLDAEYTLLLLDSILPYFAKKYHVAIRDGQQFSFDTFVAKYTPDLQSSLGMHHDDAYVTTLVTLNDDFEGGGTYFQDFDAVLKPKKGTISVHPGEITHYHGARPTTKGERYILVSFIKPVE